MMGNRSTILLLKKNSGKCAGTARQHIPGTRESEKYIDIDDIIFNPISKPFSLRNVNKTVGSLFLLLGSDSCIKKEREFLMSCLIGLIEDMAA